MSARHAIKILTLNMHKGFSSFRHRRRFVLHELREAVRFLSADIVFLQEVVGEHEDWSSRHERWPAAPQYEFLAETIWNGVAYGRNAVYQHGHHGNAILSKYPILRSRNIDISIGTEEERRGLLHCILSDAPANDTVHAICVHLGLMRQHRHGQYLQLSDVIRTQVPAHAPLIVAGDFNDWDLNVHARMVRECNLQEVLAVDGARPARTFPAFLPLLRLDRIYCRHLVLKNAAVLAQPPWSRLSDHAGIVAEVSVRRGDE